MAPIEVDGLTKHYGDVVGNEGVTFAVEEGEIFGYLGPNGAGKTTTIRTLMGLQSPTSGTARVLGADVRDERELIEARRRIGYLPANPAFDEGVTGRAVLDLHAELKGDERREELLELFDPPLDRKVREFSTGNVQKLGLIQAFMHDPDLVLMDEPTAGLDPLMQQRFNEFVRDERDAGTTLFFSSHVLSEVRRVCDRVAILREGRIVTTETVEDLLHRSGKFVRMRTLDAVDVDALDFDGVHGLDVTRTEIESSTDRPVEASPERSGGTDASAGARSAGGSSEPATGGGTIAEATFTYTGDVNALVEVLSAHRLLDLDVQEAPLEDVFMRFYGEEEPGGEDAPARRGVGDGEGSAGEGSEGDGSDGVEGRGGVGDA